MHTRTTAQREEVASMSTKHGHARNDAGRSPTYRSWEVMRARCQNQNDDNFPSYGGRGIKVCQRWQVFSNFLADMGERPARTTIDRKNPNGDYEPNNCRWASPIQQARNRRNTLNVTYQGQTKNLKDWCEEIGIGYHLVFNRLKNGHSPETAFKKDFMHKLWTDEHLTILRNHYEKTSGPQTCLKMMPGRSPFGIYSKACRLGLVAGLP